MARVGAIASSIKSTVAFCGDREIARSDSGCLKLGIRRSAAIAFTLIDPAMLNDVDSQASVTVVLGRVADHKINWIDELLPWQYGQAE